MLLLDDAEAFAGGAPDARERLVRDYERVREVRRAEWLLSAAAFGRLCSIRGAEEEEEEGEDGDDALLLRAAALGQTWYDADADADALMADVRALWRSAEDARMAGAPARLAWVSGVAVGGEARLTNALRFFSRGTWRTDDAPCRAIPPTPHDADADGDALRAGLLRHALALGDYDRYLARGARSVITDDASVIWHALYPSQTTTEFETAVPARAAHIDDLCNAHPDPLVRTLALLRCWTSHVRTAGGMPDFPPWAVLMSADIARRGAALRAAVVWPVLVQVDGRADAWTVCDGAGTLSIAMPPRGLRAALREWASMIVAAPSAAADLARAAGNGADAAAIVQCARSIL